MQGRDEPSPSSLRDVTSPERGRFYSTYRQMAKSSPPAWNDFPRPGEDGEARKGNGWRVSA